MNADFCLCVLSVFVGKIHRKGLECAEVSQRDISVSTAKLPDDFLVLRVDTAEIIGIGQFKIGKVKTRGYRTANKTETAFCSRATRKPAIRRDDILKELAATAVLAQGYNGQSTILSNDKYFQRITLVKMPALITFDPVKC